MPDRLAARVRLRRRARRDQQPRVEDGRLSTRPPASIVVPQRLGRLPLGREGQVEPRGEGRRRAARPRSCACRSPTSGRASPTVAFPYFGNREHEHFAGTDHPSVLVRNVPAKRVQLEGRRGAGRHGLRPVRRQLRPRSRLRRRATSPSPTTRTCPTRRPGRRRSPACRATRSSTVAREFAPNAEKTKGRSMVIIGAAMNHWYHCDMNYRGVINMLVMCGCVGQSGGGWSHYVGQEKLRPQIGLDAARLRARLEPPAAAAELDLVLLRPHRPVALRDARTSTRSCRRRRPPGRGTAA